MFQAMFLNMSHDHGDFVGRTSEQYNSEDTISFEVRTTNIQSSSMSRLEQ